MQTGVFSTWSGYLPWRSRSERVALPYITTSGTSSRWGAGNLPLARDIVATSSSGTGKRASSRFADHFTLAKALLPDHPQWLMSRLVFLLRLIRFSMSNASSSHAQTPNQTMELTASRRYNMVFHGLNPSRAAMRASARGSSFWSR
jgi:hypothetical protein